MIIEFIEQTQGMSFRMNKFPMFFTLCHVALEKKAGS